MKVKEIMTRDIKSVSPDMGASEALDLLLKMEISGLPVIDERNKLIGMLTEKGFLKAILPSYVEKVGGFVYEGIPKAIKQKVQMVMALKVKDIMRKEVITVNEDTTVSEIARLMLTQNIRRIPILNKSAEVVGIVSRQDVVKALFKE